MVKEERLYRKWSEMEGRLALKGMIAARKLLNDLHVDLCARGFSEVFVDQYNEDLVAITRHNPNTRESVLLMAHCAFSQFKWRPDLADHKGIPVEGEQVDNFFSPPPPVDDITEILFELKTVEVAEEPVKAEDDASVLSGVQNVHVEVYEHVPVDKSLAVKLRDRVVMFENFPSGSVVAFK